ncbi:hypothetical protein LX32DRAFT_635302 [Colletotrichum zoysiae]|uniref:Uncharacterized protein n=1 Tax=Colletotrichum zoysiae TaxID=1216348 RepID=A0AAD9HQJ6_9PEZI|nr:hypothetical protein LX32DRAFT_635302 [Colletotrichum zoysiae]
MFSAPRNRVPLSCRDLASLLLRFASLPLLVLFQRPQHEIAKELLSSLSYYQSLWPLLKNAGTRAWRPTAIDAWHLDTRCSPVSNPPSPFVNLVYRPVCRLGAPLGLKIPLRPFAPSLPKPSPLTHTSTFP